jgi:predicted DNA-binding protein (MmcQ/YjbR family)
MPHTSDTTSHPLYTKVAEIFLALPDTTMEMKWGEPHFCVVGKIFGGFDVEADGRVRCGMKLEMDHADARVSDDPRFTRAPYVGHKGWVTFDLGDAPDWALLRALTRESYGLIAPKRSLMKIDGAASAKKAPAKKAPAKKKAVR